MLETNFLKKNKFKIYINLKKKKYFFRLKIFNYLINIKKIFLKKIYFLNKLKKNNKILTLKKYIIKIFNIYKNYLKKINKNLKILLLKMPNLIHYLVLRKNKIIRNKNYIKKNINRKFNFNTNIGALTSGKGFSFITHPLSLLYNKIENYIFNLHLEENNYKYIVVPNIMNFKSLINSGQIPKFIKKLFILKNKNKIKYLIPTSEVSLLNFLIKKNINSKFIPLKLISKTNCYRNEIISYGLNNKDIIKQKQFDKIELMNFVDNKNSYRYLKELIKNVEKILKNLKISYRIIILSKKNISYISNITYDLEIWMPSINNYCEVSSCSNLQNYQSLRSKIKYKFKKKNEYISIINGSALAIGRIFLSIIENYYYNNKIIIPKTLKKYFKIKYIKI
ncbi:seryl-tRNA synthetase [Candidatus Nasuia deltocephalinicola str. NAS-ALF]|uniref:serine--tRNA ligase n=1 Tax=Candidatus Nasuia deltocephalinicola str. NAS-ALF TaxID=1343077 RepID=S5SQL6_9PROT|nr:seryl-tRNA synthetase [Candidatus Nasuia deltocephalinicola str. NAS-ALF]